MAKGLLLSLVTGTCLLSGVAQADIQHTIGKGHTIEAISNRYHVPAKTIMEANHLKDAKHLKVGDVLTIPKADSPKDKEKDKDKVASADKDKKDPKAKAAHDTKDAKAEHSNPTTFQMKPKTPGVIHISRAGSAEELDLKITDHGSHVAPATTKAFEKLMRFPNGAAHPIDARLISLLGIVSNHFGSRKIQVVSGFRPYTPTQYTPHSNHNHGKAIDFRVVGVPNEVVRDFCRTLRNTGCGYYPNSTFVHMDARDASAFWIDYSKPGEPPRYNAANVDADEGTSDVHGSPAASSPAANTPAPATPAPEAPASDDKPEPAKND